MRFGTLSNALLLFCFPLASHASVVGRQAQTTATAQPAQDGTRTTVAASITTPPVVIITDLPNLNSTSTASVIRPTTNTTSSLLPNATSNSTLSIEPVIPLTPTLSAANILVGIFLLIPGLLYGFYSIRHILIHNFLSVAYTTSLAVACLIIYVEANGASNGQHAGYVVGTILASILLGGLSSPFANIFNGLGCFLGGFCLSMWFLTIKDNGLMQSTPGKIILVLVMSLSIGVLGFIRFTRDRALLFCIPFSAATAIVLGIDSFTRAGYKEFWIFVWGFNMNIFPLNTSSYPITRTMRVESSLIIVIYIFGLLINTKFWKVLQKHLKAEKQDRRRREMDLERMEAEVGLRTEKRVARELHLWERLYGSVPKVEPSVNHSSAAVSKESFKPSSRGSDEGTNERPVSEVNTIEIIEMASAADSIPMKALSRTVSESAGIKITVQDATSNVTRKDSTDGKTRQSQNVKMITEEPIDQLAASHTLVGSPRGSITRSSSSRSKDTIEPVILEEPELESEGNWISSTKPNRGIAPRGPTLRVTNTSGQTSPVEKPREILHMIQETEGDEVVKSNFPISATPSTPEKPTLKTQRSLESTSSAANETTRASTLEGNATSPSMDGNQVSSYPASTISSLGNVCESPIQEENLKLEDMSTLVNTSLKAERLLGRRERSVERRDQKFQRRSSSTGHIAMPVSAFTQSTPNVSSTKTNPRSNSPFIGNRTNSPQDLRHSSSRQRLLRQSSDQQLRQQRRSSSTGPSPTPNRPSIARQMSDTYQPSDPNRSSSYLPTPAARISRQSMLGTFDSHPPQRESGRESRQQQVARFASWHNALQNDPGTNRNSTAGAIYQNPDITISSIESSREQMLQEKRMREHLEFQNSINKAQREQVMDQTMRHPTGIMMHSQRLSQLQSQVKVD